MICGNPGLAPETLINRWSIYHDVLTRKKIWLYIVFATCLGNIAQKPIVEVSAPYSLTVIALNEEESILF